MGFKIKMCIVAVGVAAGVLYYMNRKRAKDREPWLQQGFHELIINDLGHVTYMYTEDDDDDDSSSDSNYWGIGMDYDDSDSSYCYDDVDDYLLDIEDGIVSIGTFGGRNIRPRFTIARKRLHNKKKKATKKKKPSSGTNRSKVSEAFNEECPICTDSFTDATPFVTLDCKHRLHNACAFGMARHVRNLVCPLCRQDVEVAL